MLKHRIRALRKSKGMSQAEFGEEIGVTQSTVARWEKGSWPDRESLVRLADMSNTSVDKLVSADDEAGASPGEIPVVGYVGAGAQVLGIDDYSRGDGMAHVARPPSVTGRAVAVEVRGDSLLPTAEDGWRMIYTDEDAFTPEDLLNRLCVVRLTDGRTLVKRVIRGTKSGLYHLVSTNAPMIEDVEIEWAARVKAIIPA